MDTNYQDRIDLYLSGRMPFVDRLNFEEELKNNSELQDQYQFTVLLQEEMLDRKTKKELIQSWNDSDDSMDSTDFIEEDVEFVSINSARKKWYRTLGWVAAAAVFLLLFIIIWPESSHQKRDMVQAEQRKQLYSPQMQLDKRYVEEVAYHDEISTSKERLSYEQQRKCWDKAQYYRAHGQRDECVRCLKILLQQEGMYRDKADSLLHVIYQSQK